MIKGIKAIELTDEDIADMKAERAYQRKLEVGYFRNRSAVEPGDRKGSNA